MKLKDYLEKAKREKRAIGQFNFSTLIQLRGILDAAKKLKTPVILGTSQGELNSLGLEEVVALVEISKKKWGVEAFLNLDHGNDLELIKKCVDYGFSAVHFDGSGLSLEKNIEYAKIIVQYAHKKGVLVEGELDAIGGKESTSLAEAKRFVEETSVDSLAVAIGNVHGIKKVNLDLVRLKDFSKVSAFIVLHGGSGISSRQIKEAIKLGIVKININTELRIAWKKGLLKALESKEIKPYKIMPFVQKSVQKKVEEKIKLFGS